MPDDQLRPEQVARLTATPPLPAELTDAILDATDAERAAAAAELLDSTRAVLEQTGHLQRSRSLLDLNHHEMEALTAVFGLMMAWSGQPGWCDRPYRHLLKVVPADVAEVAMRLYRLLRAVPPEPEGKE